MNQSAYFNSQFFLPAVAGVARVAAGCRLFTRPAGSTTLLQSTTQDQAGAIPNANPIVLDGDGRCKLWLTPALEYLLELRTPVVDGDALIGQWDDVVGAAATTGIVTSVNGSTGAVALSAPDVPYVTSSSATWLTATNVEAALDQIANRTAAPPAVDVTVTDSGAYFVGANVEAVLAELGAGSVIPARTGRNECVLALAAGALAWERRETCYTLSATDGSVASRVVVLSAGTWQIVLDARAYFDTPTGAISATQVGSVGGVDVTATINFNRSGASGHGYLIHGSDIAVGTLVVAAEATHTLSLAAMTLNGAVAKGSTLRVEKIA